MTAVIGEINPTTHAVTEFALPTTGTTKGNHVTNNGPSPYAITAGPDGNLWFTEQGTSKIGMINPATHVITEFPTPTSTPNPYAITAGPDGNLWFTEDGNANGYPIGRSTRRPMPSPCSPCLTRK